MVWTRCATAEGCVFMVSMPQMIKAAIARQDNRRVLPISIECASSCPRSSLVSQSDAPAAAWSSPTLWAKRQEPPTSSLCILSTLHVSSIPSPSGHAVCPDENGRIQSDIRGDGRCSRAQLPQIARAGHGVYGVGRQRRSSAVMTSPPKTPSRSKCSRALQDPYKESLPAITRWIPRRRRYNQRWGKAYLSVVHPSGRSARLLRCLVHLAWVLVSLSQDLQGLSLIHPVARGTWRQGM